MPLHRRVFCAASAAFLVAPARAQFKVEISGVGATQLPIAIARFRNEEKAAQSVSTIVRADLERSGVFRGLEVSAVIDEIAQPAMADWRARGVLRPDLQKALYVYEQADPGGGHAGGG